MVPPTAQVVVDGQDRADSEVIVVTVNGVSHVHVLPLYVYVPSSTTQLDDEVWPITKHSVVDGQEIPSMELKVVTIVGLPQEPPWPDVMAPPPKVLPTAKHWGVDGHDVPVIAIPDCWSAHDPLPLIRAALRNTLGELDVEVSCS
jgi:hypothetical protein